jgi:hypothetical protein
MKFRFRRSPSGNGKSPEHAPAEQIAPAIADLILPMIMSADR